MEPRAYCLLLHLSQLAGFAVPVLGWVLPVVMWAVHKDQSQEVDVHGRIVINWLITELIAFVVCLLLILVFVGFPLLVILLLVGILYPIIGAVKANDGVVWHYPGAIRFL